MKHENEKVEIYLPQTLVTHEGSSAAARDGVYVDVQMC